MRVTQRQSGTYCRGCRGKAQGERPVWVCTRVCKVHRETARASGPRVSACWVEDWLSTPLGTE